MTEIGAWLSSRTDAQLMCLFIGAGCFIIAFGAFLMWLGSDPYRYRAVRRRPVDPEPWQREPTTGHPIIRRPTADAFPPHIPAVPVVPPPKRARHRAQDTRGETRMIGSDLVARARAMVPGSPLPKAPVPPGETLRSLKNDWRDTFPGSEEFSTPSEGTQAWWARQAELRDMEDEVFD